MHAVLEAPTKSRRPLLAKPAMQPSKPDPWAVGARVTDRDGQPVHLTMTVFAPFRLVHRGVVVANYGDDHAAAEVHYVGLVRDRCVELGQRLEHRQWSTSQAAEYWERLRDRQAVEA